MPGSVHHPAGKRHRARHSHHAQSGGKVGRAGVAFLQTGGTGPADDGVPLPPQVPLCRSQILRHLRELHAILPGTDLIEHFSQTIDVRSKCARAFWGHKSLRADVRTLSVDCDKTDIGELPGSLYIYDVGRLDVPVGQAVAVHVAKGVCEEDSRLFALLKADAPPVAKICGECAGHVRVISTSRPLWASSASSIT